ncbi:hypothetical protein HMPREF1619_01390 [Klebsiella pneumoniae 909957]|nr:hypothetical protein HMPREF1619_01390 [Klebsiella pneumoniae 909957]
MSRAEPLANDAFMFPCRATKWQCILNKASDDIPANRETEPYGKVDQHA